jgi:hypothetical protein
MEESECPRVVLSRLDLDDIEKVVGEAYHKEGAGRLPWKQIDIFKALIIERVRQIPSDRELYRGLWRSRALLSGGVVDGETVVWTLRSPRHKQA